MLEARSPDHRQSLDQFLLNLTKKAASSVVGLVSRQQVSFSDVCTILNSGLRNPELDGNAINNEHLKSVWHQFRPVDMLPEHQQRAIRRFIDDNGLDSIYDFTKAELAAVLNSFGFEGTFQQHKKSVPISKIFEMVDSSTGDCRKIFAKTAGTTGGFIFAFCGHGFVLVVKLLLKVENVQVQSLSPLFCFSPQGF